MYLQGTMSVDPKQLTHIIKKKPTKAFKRLLYLMTAGMVSDKMEHETFCAISILQQLNQVFRSMGVTNIVHLAKDDVDFYLDDEGKQDDLKEALEEFKLEVDTIESSAFQTLKLVLEHEDDLLHYFIAIHIERVHRKGIYPIRIEVDGLIREFTSEQEEPDALKNRMRQQLKRQEDHDRLLAAADLRFEMFLSKIGSAMKIYVGVDDVKNTHHKALIRPKGSIKTRDRLTQRDADRPVYYGYHGSNDLFLYAWLWSEIAHDNHFHINDCHVIDEAGATLMSVGENGFDAGAGNALDPDAEFALPESGDIEVGNSSDLPADIATDASKGWFDDISFDGGDAGDAGDSGCSSCSSCSSCGGCS